MASYSNILKTTGLIGFVQIFQIVFGLIRNKVLALLVGASGFGIWGLYNTYVEMVSQISILGLDQSGVRQIAKNSKDTDYTGKCIYVFRNVVIILSIIFTTITVLFSKYISNTLFGTEKYYWGVIVVSFSIFFNSISRASYSILNGLQNIRSLAVSQILSAIVGSIAAIVLVSFWGVEGIPFYISIVGLTAAIITWRSVVKLKVVIIKPSFSEAKRELKLLFSLGIGFSIAGIVSAVMSYFSRLYLSNYFSLETVGIYQASWTISNLYIGTILTAMGVDLMPRMMKVVDDNRKMNIMVNEQMELGVLISGIGIVAILLFSPLVLNVFFSKEFITGTTIIRWQVLGVSLRVLAFPFSYAIMARGKVFFYIAIQFVFAIVEYGFLILFSKIFGFNGLGVNYFLAYCLYLFMSWLICYKLIDFRISPLLKRIAIITYAFVGIAFLFCWMLTPIHTMLLGFFLIIFYGCWILYELKRSMDINVLTIIIKFIEKNKE